ncbi:MAG: hypothetical protein ABIK09_04850 [Pseudomonadota bacterium]
MRCRVIVVAALVSFAACKGGGESAEVPSVGKYVVQAPEDLQETPWGEIVILKSELWSLVEGGGDDPDLLIGALDDWYRERSGRIREACLEAARRPIEEPGAWEKPLIAFSRWQLDVAQPRSDMLLRTVHDPRISERLQLFDQRCLDAAATAAPTNRGAPEDPWARYISLRMEIHALVEHGLSQPGPTLRAGAAWYDDHADEIRSTCLRMSALSGAAGSEDRIEDYTTYLRSVGQRTVEKLISKIPVMVPGPGDARGLFELMNRFDRICAGATSSRR